MEVGKSRRFGERHRSPYARRSRSRSPAFRRKHPDFVTSRDRSQSPPSRLSPKQHSMLSTDKQHPRKADIPSSTFQVATDLSSFTDVGRFSSTHVNPPPITLTERFTRITASGTAVYNKRFSARSFGDTRHIPHLIITNNTQLPLATLIRQAKAISVVIDRKFPSGKKRPVDDAPMDDNLYIPRRTNEGMRPVFDRPEIQLYRSSSEEAQIAKRLIECVSTTSKSRISSSMSSLNSYSYDESAVAVSNRFFGSRVDEFSSGANYARPSNPLDTPRHPSYFMHDDRDNPGPIVDRPNWRGRLQNNPGNRRDYNRRSTSRERSPMERSPRRGLNSGRWQHDKFERDVPAQTTKQQEHSRPMPKPVPAPKPMLWSTIGKEIINGEEKMPNRSNRHDDDHANNKTDEKSQRPVHLHDDSDLQIDMEPVLDESIDES